MEDASSLLRGDLYITAEAEAFVKWHAGRLSWAQPTAEGRIQLDGPPSLVRAFPTWNARSMFAHIRPVSRRHGPGRLTSSGASHCGTALASTATTKLYGDVAGLIRVDIVEKPARPPSNDRRKDPISIQGLFQGSGFEIGLLVKRHSTQSS